jgi:DNA-binding SARP family transcriptional activator
VRDGGGLSQDFTGAAIRIGVLGPFQVARGEGEVTVPTPMVGRLGAVLALSPRVPVSAERLTADLWPKKPPATAPNALQVYVSQLRRLIAPVEVTHRSATYSLDIDESFLDESRFAHQVAQAELAMSVRQFDETTALCEEALRLWRGTPYDGLVSPEAIGRRERLQERREQVLDLHLAARLEGAASLSEVNEVVAEAQGRVAQHPLREPSYRILMRALAAADRRAEACLVFEDLARRMKARMGLPPSAETQRVRALIQEGSTDLIPSALR